MKPFVFIIDSYPLYGYGLKELISERKIPYQTLVFDHLASVSRYAQHSDRLILFVDLFLAISQSDQLNTLIENYPSCTLIITTPEKSLMDHLDLSSLLCHYTLSKMAQETDLNDLMIKIEASCDDNQPMKALLTQPKTRDEFCLNPRDLELLSLLAMGLTNREIGQQLYLAEKTIKNNLTRLYAHIGVQNRVEATRFALSHGLGQLSKS